MGYRACLAIAMFGPLFVLESLFAQAAKPPSLKEQLEAQYAPETVLAIQKDGVLGVAPIIIKTCSSKFANGNLKPPDASCYAPIKDSSRILTVGEKVNPKGVRVNPALETISLDLVECDSCNKGVPTSSYKAQIEFQFAKGYLEKGNVPEIEDTIGQVLSIAGDEDKQAQASPEANEQLTNNDVIEMVKAKLPDRIIISKIKNSASNFDTSPKNLISLANANVGGDVIQAMLDAQSAANAPADNQNPVPASAQAPDAQPQGPATVPGQLSISVKHHHNAFFNFSTSAVEYYCYGSLTVSPDGTVAYDCDRTDDPSGRCEHVSFEPGSLKQAKMGFAGVFHIESKKQGKWDFYGRQEDLKQALEKISSQTQK